MLWARFDCQSPSHPKLVRAGAEAAWLWHASICYSNLHQLDGRIPKDLLPLLYHPLAKRSEKLAEKLCELRLWHNRGDHFEIHDYEVFQAEAMKAEMELKREARREYERDRKRVQRSGEFVPDDVPDIDDGESGTVSQEVGWDSSRAQPRAPAGVCLSVVSESEFALSTDPKISKARQLKSDARKVFEHWKRVWGKSGATVFGHDRERVVLRALKAYPLEDVLDAVEGAHMDKFLLGDNAERKVYSDLTTHLKSTGKIEEHRDTKRQAGSAANNNVAAPYHNRISDV